MAKKKKTNPRKKPATLADVNRAKKKAEDDGIKAAFIVMFSVMHDKYGWGAVRMQRLFDYVGDMSESVAQGYVSLKDLEKMLADEAKIYFTD